MLLLHNVPNAAILALDGPIGMPRVEFDVLEGVPETSPASVAERDGAINFNHRNFRDELLCVAAVPISRPPRMLFVISHRR